MADWYAARGFAVLARNFRTPRGEIDVIARKDGVLVFCEVKARTSTTYGDPWDAVTPAKQNRLRRAAAQYLQEHPGRLQIRFDVAAVTGTSIEVLEDAF